MKVSIIIPVFNNEDGLCRCLSGVFDQSYSQSDYEVIVIDNGSDVSPEAMARKYPVIYLEENDYKGSPYSARNRGFERATGDVIVLLDTTCKPDYYWIESGVHALENADLIGGEVKFDVCDKSNISEIYDSLHNINMKGSIINNKVAKTTNLFFKRKVLDEIGAFPEGLRSGGDVRWTSKAVKKGFILGYSESAYVIMLPRGFRPLLSKQWRVAKGMPQIWRESDTFLVNFIKKGLLFFIPPNPVRIKGAAENSGLKLRFRTLWSLFFLGYFFRIVTSLAIFKSMLLVEKK